jgi:hypothetical protein
MATGRWHRACCWLGLPIHIRVSILRYCAALQQQELAKIKDDVENKGLNLIVFGEWYNLENIQRMRFFDDNTRSWWTPVTGAWVVSVCMCLCVCVGGCVCVCVCVHVRELQGG